MGLNFHSYLERLRAFEFTPLFLENLGWDNRQQAFTVKVDSRAFRLTALAIKARADPMQTQ
jgi:hypothetical protein